MSDIEEAWRLHGESVIARAMFSDPAGTLKALIGILPRQAKLEITMPTDDLTLDRLENLIAYAEQQLAGRMIDVTPVVVPAPMLPTPTSQERRAEAVRLDLEDETRQIEAGEKPRDDVSPEDLF